MKTKTFCLVAILLSGWCLCSLRADDSWLAVLKQELPRLGHRNWIVIADSAYPAQSNPAIRTVATRSAQLQVLKTVLEEIRQAGHVKPIVYLDAELASFPENLLPGIAPHRSALEELLRGYEINRAPHEELIKKLDSAADLFEVLILKTDLKLPYTSVFLLLDCAYWGADAEKARIEALKKGK
jgi:hypothetical protein